VAEPVAAEPVAAEPVAAEPEPAPVAAAAGSALSQIDGQADDNAVPTLAGVSGVAAPAARPLTYTGPSEDGGSEVRRSTQDASDGTGEPSRNAPCPCGSGRKYKRCHGAPTTAHS